MPGTAAGLADVGAADADPLELGGRIEHFAEQVAILGLDLRPVGESRAGFADALGETVADRLQLTEVEHPRRGGDAVDTVGDLGMAEGLSEERAQLRLEA